MHSRVSRITTNSPQTAFLEHCARVRESDKTLESAEADIDRFVLKTLKTKEILSANEFDEIEKWLLTAPGKSRGEFTRSRTEPLSQREFAERFICSLAIDNQPIELASADFKWLEAALQSSIPDWINERFAEFQRQQFAAACIESDDLLRNFRALSQSHS